MLSFPTVFVFIKDMKSDIRRQYTYFHIHLSLRNNWLTILVSLINDIDSYNGDTEFWQMKLIDYNSMFINLKITTLWLSRRGAKSNSLNNYNYIFLIVTVVFIGLYKTALHIDKNQTDILDISAFTWHFLRDFNCPV